ncbi:hypothetical protein HYQ46_008974 [Verticillium longisporum]|nr:hypothetical protein HYQ46_008974 [Verticillium longisporum]
MEEGRRSCRLVASRWCAARPVKNQLESSQDFFKARGDDWGCCFCARIDSGGGEVVESFDALVTGKRGRAGV